MSEDMMDPFNDDFDDEPMNDFFGNLGRNMFRSMPSMGNEMRTDVTDDGKNFHVTAELPGFKKNDIHMDYRNNTLRIHATHKIDRKSKNDKTHVLRQERSNSNVARSFRLPNVDFNKISASYDGGLLKVNLPKEAGKQNQGHQINIK